MKLCVFNPVLGAMSLEQALKYLSELKVDAMELGCGGSPGKAHADILELDANPKKVADLKKMFENYGIEIAALSVHGNGVHPNPVEAKLSTDEFEAACRVAKKLGVGHVVTFSGCPGDGKGDKPNWVTCCWPNDFTDVLNYQWDDVLIPYWRKEAKIAEDCGVKVCIEMHPGFNVYNPETMMRLRNATSKAIGANFDPSHLLWQGIDPVEAIKYLGDAVHFFHAKDTYIDKRNTSIKGVLDTAPYANELSRSWYFRTVGYGIGDFKAMVSALRLVGYDHVLSIEHEDSLMTTKEGLEKAVSYLKDVMLREPKSENLWWV